ncbi:MAG TPA: ribonucleoside-diphosphate reductase subunit alpha [Candidatus Obscuribacter sp.]|nr:ribonucleoside-diphosphate reductase subunit alpha [Candidatus Obscuribacter sp.]MBK9278082.1 ribonucleoside-diphosphate reductase subunit alpha [Candidatus Obscuribacter sp.]MBL8082322.1 ribonucleoside-diphosphate reductase subunit alpha [Candidatus Obscuribacter sp.]HMY02691.1 ribonucleoside-diphosphate reductase subunit alpha [Candidatus Obscuribacter sp.]HMY51354.1 ribonucleoside-diphosphate reductase subunit alpha [Candidatus Obscuribacter sp.]
MTQVLTAVHHADPAGFGLSDERIGQFALYKVLRRNGNVVEFDPSKIAVAMTKAFLAVEGTHGRESSRVRDLVNKLTGQVVETLMRRLPEGGVLHIEHIQDQVELAMMRAGEQEVARGYVLYREARAKDRAARGAEVPQPVQAGPNVKRTDGTMVPLSQLGLNAIVKDACAGLGAVVEPESIYTATIESLYEGVQETEVVRSAIMSARALIETDPAYSFATARLLLHQMRLEVLGEGVSQEGMKERYATYFPEYIAKGIKVGLLDPRLATFDLEKISNALCAERDLKFQYLGLQTLYDRYLLHQEGIIFELPQAFWMRVAMGLSINEIDRETRAIEFYNLLSNFDFVSSTPTLFNSGTHRPQLSSCFLTTVDDDLSSIYEAVRENALLSKFSGGLGNDWTPVRALGAHISGTNGKSQGVVPFLKVVNDTAVAVNQGGKRKGAVCCYLETWHMDIEEFLELRKNTGDDRRRTHDMNTANWIPDLFMDRVLENAQWTLFSPDEVPDLHNLFGKKFKEAYERYERLADEGQIKLFKRVPAINIWRKMLTMLFETGHPWMTFKDPCNLRSPQQHVGVVHSSNLCTEITLNTSESETAVCNLGSINLVAHVKDGKLDLEKLAATCRVAMRMLDNVIDINYYSVPKARNSNLRHRPVGLGVMGFQDALLTLRLPYASEAAVEFADYCQEAVSYYAILASSELAKERGAYNTFKGSLWDKGILPQDSLKLLAEARGGKLDVDTSSRLDWTPVREHIARHGMRNSNCLAIAPTATISNIIGVSQSIEPTFQNLYVKSNLSGEFTVVNTYLVEDLKRLGLWDEVMVHDLKYFDGSLRPIDRIPDEVKALYATAFEVEPRWLVEAASRRQKWIDQAQSLNLYMAEPSGRKLDETYKLAWTKALKTTYYLRTASATAPEKSTTQIGVLNKVPMAGAPKACSITDPDCEACQ